MEGRADSAVAAWLQDLGLSHYAPLFMANDITLEVMPDLTSEDLREIGVTSVGHRRRILTAAAALSGPAPENRGAWHDPFIPASLPQDMSERRLVTVLFCDLVDSTSLAAAIDAEEFVALIQAYQGAVAGAILAAGGHVAQYLGDGIMAVFGYPVAAGHDAERAIHGAVAALEALARLPEMSGHKARARIGIATGMSVVGRTEGQGISDSSPIGETSNLASRIQSVAPPGGIVVSPQTRKLAGNLFDWQDLGLHDLKGIGAPVRLYLVLGSSAASSRFDALRGSGQRTRFVGRVVESSALRGYLDKAWARRGGVALITGEPGIGKSRFAWHVLESSQGPGLGQARPLVLQCSPFQNAVAFAPIRFFVLRRASLRAEDTAEEARRKLLVFLTDMGLEVAENLDLLEQFVDLQGTVPDQAARAKQQDTRQRMMALLGDILVARCRQSSTLIVEDAQWLDPSTSALLLDLMPRLSNQGIAVLATARSGTRPDWLVKAQVLPIALDRLTEEETAELISQIPDPQQGLTPQVIATIASRADGVPIYAEELARSFLEQLGLGGSGPVQVPATLSESILARLDRLKHGRRLAPLAAAIGREFPVAALAAVAGLPAPDLDRGIDELVNSGILVRVQSMYGQSIRFQENLVRDTAYELLLRRERPGIHARIADTLEQAMPKLARSLPQVLAHHRSEAGQMELATEAWKRAGQEAMLRSAYEEAADYFGRAITSHDAQGAEATPGEAALELHLNRMSAFVCAHGYQAPEVKREGEILARLSNRMNTGQHLVRALSARWMQLAATNNIKGALGLALQLRESTKGGNEIDQLIAERMCGTSLLFRGELRPALDSYRRFMARYDADRHGPALKLDHADHMLMVMVGLAETLVIMGDFEAANEWRTRALDSARKSGRDHDHFQVLVYVGCFHALLMDRMDLLSTHVAELSSMIQKNPLPFWAGFCDLFSGLLLTANGETDAGLDQSLGGIQRVIDAGSFGHWWTLLPVEPCLLAGRLQDAAALLDRARVLRPLGDLRIDPEFLRLDAKLHLLTGGAVKDTVRKLHAAHELARTSGAGLFLPRIEADLAILAGSVVDAG